MKPYIKPRELEKIVKGFSNHRRIQIMSSLDREPGLSVLEIAKMLNINFRTASEHLRRLVIAGLIEKKSEDRFVRHRLSSRGKVILIFLRTLEC